MTTSCMLLPCKHAQYDLLIFFPCSTQQKLRCFQKQLNVLPASFAKWELKRNKEKNPWDVITHVCNCYAECKFFGVLVGQKNSTHIQITTHVTLRNIYSLCVGVVYKWLLTCDSIHLWFPHLLHKQTQHLKRFDMKTIFLQYCLLCMYLCSISKKSIKFGGVLFIFVDKGKVGTKGTGGSHHSAFSQNLCRSGLGVWFFFSSVGLCLSVWAD